MNTNLFVCLSLVQEYGDIEYCVIIKNKATGESKGLGYVRYYKPSQAAVAIENCDKSKMVSKYFTGGRRSCMKKYWETSFFTFLHLINNLIPYS